MNKKIVSLVLALICVVACAFAFTACDNNKENEPYYGKTYTLTGKVVVDWTSKYYYDNYTQDYNNKYSQKDLLKKHWDEIDWDKTLSAAGLNANDVPHGTVDEFIALFEDFEENAFEQLNGLKLSFSDKKDLKLTMTLPQNWMEEPDVSDHYDSVITMPFCETQAQYEQNKPYAGIEDTRTFGFEKGYLGVGVYKTENHVLAVEFSVEKYVNDIRIGIVDYELDADGNLVQATDFLTSDHIAMYILDAQGNSILSIQFFFNFEVK